jgi:parvulin-like peptidyl-prolyl isomerase
MTTFLPLAVTLAFSALQTPQGDQVVATVDGTPIRAKDVDRALWDWYSADVIEEMIVNAVVTNALKAEGIKLDQKEVDGFFARLLEEAKVGFAPGVNLDEELRKQGMPRTRLAARAATEMGLRKLTEARFKPEEMRKIAWIMIKPTGAAADQKAAARLNADETLKLLTTQPWSEVVKAKSQDASSALRGGELGWFNLGELPKEVADEMRSLQAGGHTGVHDSQGLFAIYQVAAVGPPPASELESAKNAYVARNLQKVYQDLKLKAKIERKSG